jgi:peptidoglycan/LPS O-acetylase OafA/YrhL
MAHAAPPPRNLALDGLRGIAAFLVMLYHFASVIYPAILTGDRALAHGGWDAALHASAFWVLLNGAFAVAIFFVLSGYVLTRDAFITGETTRLRHRAAGRLVRLGLPAGASTLAVFALLQAGAYHLRAAQALSGADAVFNSGTLFSFPLTLASLEDNLFWRTWFAPVDITRMYNLVLWTMPVELWGSFIVFAAGLILLQARLRTAVLAGLAVILWAAVPANGPALASFVGGAVLASTKRRLPAPLGIAVIGLALGSYNTDRLFGLRAGMESTLYGLGAVLLVAGVLHAPPLQRLLTGRWPQRLGRISFALYLVHQPIIFSLGAALFVALEPFGYAPAAAVSFLAVLAVALPLAVVAERWIDRPATRLAHRFATAVLRPAQACP